MLPRSSAAFEPADDGITPGEVEDEGPSTTSLESDPEWIRLLAYLLDARGFDFHGYKTASLGRRIRKRMDAVGQTSFAGYQEYLEQQPTEFATLFNTVLINVTRFFRDPLAWEAVRSLAIPDILSRKKPDDPVRAWSAGCATGEEAYTIAMVLAEELGPEQFARRVKIYATDLDEEALATARHAGYNDRQVEGLSQHLLERYFDQVDGVYFFRKDFRRQVIFGRHDLISDAPISRIDLLTCRNTLMYLNAETQARVLDRLHFALNDDGYLLLGRAETMMTQPGSFAPVDLKQRLSRKVAAGGRRERHFGREEESPMNPSSDIEGRIQAAALDSSPAAQIVVDAAGNVAMLNEKARALFELRSNDLGRPLRDLPISFRPVELRSLIEKVEAERRPVVIKEIEMRGHGADSRWLDLTLAPITSGDAVIGTVITYADVTGYHKLQREVDQSQHELETAYEELQSTNEELETTNEELQSTVEELETTNEELQSTNEELETMNEELHSTNEELQSMNDELRQRGDDLNSANAFLESVLTSLKDGVAVVDRDLKVLAWNKQAEELWGLRESEVNGKHLLNLDIGLPVDRLTPAIRSCFDGDGDGQRLLLDAVNRRGKPIRCKVSCTPLLGPQEEVRGAMVLMEATQEGSA